MLGSLLPGSVLELEAARPWRNQLLDQATPTFLATFGDHSLFRYALVQVGAVVLSKNPRSTDRPGLVSVWTDEQRTSVGEALRVLRRVHSPDMLPLHGDGWRVGLETPAQLRERREWRPMPRRLEPIMSDIARAVPTVVGDLFRVLEGVQAGYRGIFLLPMEEWAQLPEKERRFFRPTAGSRNIRDGRIVPGAFHFYPIGPSLPSLKEEHDLRRHLPVYFGRYLLPHRHRLERRPAVRARAGPHGVPWWELNRPRSRWLKVPMPKIVTAYFGREGSFAFDEQGDHLVVQGHGWLPTSKLNQSLKQLTSDVIEDFSPAFSAAYVALLNSSIFASLLAEFCPHVAGGQLNLSKRFIDAVPLPDLPRMSRESLRMGLRVRDLEHIGFAITRGELSFRSTLESIVAEIYGIPPERWPEVA